MEQMLQGEPMDAEAIAAWRQRYAAALATAEKGEGWSETTARARGLAEQLHAAVKVLSLRKAALQKAQGLQAQGARALKGYRPY